jgi:hypothetical protein
MQCRTAALGGPIQACPDGHRSRLWSTAWRHRSCLHGEHVPFRSRTRSEETAGGERAPQWLTLPVADFLQRWRPPVPVPQPRVIRSYGLDQSLQAEALTLCRTALGHPPVVVPVGLDWQTVWAQRGDAPPERGPACGQGLVCTGVIPRGGLVPRVPGR